MYTLFPYADVEYDKDNKHLKIIVKLLSDVTTQEIRLTVPLNKEAIDFLEKLE